MMLLLDIGNSRSKWAMIQAGRQVGKGVFNRADAPTLLPIFADLPMPSRIVVSNVAGEPAAAQVQALGTIWRCPVEFITAQSEQCGVRNGYVHPQRLGSDRWAALIAAWQAVQGACLVVNCGTATTVDALSAQGYFMGGLIVCGLDMMQASLAAGAVQLERGAGTPQDFPVNTADAICSGAISATLGAIENQFNLLRKKEVQARCIVSGGAAAQVMPHLTIPFEYMDNLVLRGVQIIGESKA